MSNFSRHKELYQAHLLRTCPSHNRSVRSGLGVDNAQNTYGADLGIHQTSLVPFNSKIMALEGKKVVLVVGETGEQVVVDDDGEFATVWQWIVGMRSGMYFGRMGACSDLTEAYVTAI